MSKLNKVLVTLKGKDSNISFLVDTRVGDSLKSVSRVLKVYLGRAAGPLSMLLAFGGHYGTVNIDPYPSYYDIQAGTKSIEISWTTNGWDITVYEITASYSSSLRTKKLKTFSCPEDLLAWACPPSFTFEKGGVYIFEYDGGSNPGSQRVVEVEEVNTSYILAKDLTKNESKENAIRNFTLSKISNPRKVK